MAADLDDLLRRAFVHVRTRWLAMEPFDRYFGPVVLLWSLASLWLLYALR